jgi:hypothetical protein
MRLVPASASKLVAPPHWQFADAAEMTDEPLVNDALGSIHLADSTGTDEDLETGDARLLNFPTHED